MSVLSGFRLKTNFELFYFSFSHAIKTWAEYKNRWEIFKKPCCLPRRLRFGTWILLRKRVVKGGYRSRFTENKTVLSQITKNKIGISRFTKKKRTYCLHFEKLRPKQSLPSCCHFPFCAMQKGNRVPSSTYHEWHHLPPLQNHQSSCRSSRHRIRRADRLLGPSMLARLLLLLPWENSGCSALSTRATLTLASAKDCTPQKSNTALLKNFEISMGCDRKRKTGFLLVNQYFFCYLRLKKNTYSVRSSRTSRGWTWCRNRRNRITVVAKGINRDAMVTQYHLFRNNGCRK